MALVELLKIGSDGLQAEHDAATDELSMLDYQINGVYLGTNNPASVDGPTEINDDATAYTYFTPAGNTLRETLEAIDAAIGTINTDNARDIVQYTNDNAGAITLGQAVYISSADSVDLANNSADATDDPMGLVYEASIASAASGDIVTNGLAIGVISGATAGDKYYLQSTDGVIGTTVPTASGQNVVFMGIAKNATDLQLRIQNIGKRA